MDPKNLDPKLQEAYNRVMNTSTSGDQPSPPNTASELPQQVPDQPQDIASTSEISVNQAETPSDDNPKDNQSNPWQASGIPTASSQSNGRAMPQASYAQGNNNSFRLFYIIGAVFFMVLYAVFWLKILGFF